MKYEKPEYLEDAPVFENNYVGGRQNEIKKALNPQGFEAGEEGIEPPLTVLETAALPLYYSPICYCLLCSSPTDMSITQVF